MSASKRLQIARQLLTTSSYGRKHFGKSGGAASAHHTRLSNYYTPKNTFAEELPSTTTHFSMYDSSGYLHIPSPKITTTKMAYEKGESGVMHKPVDHGPGYMSFKPYKAKSGSDLHFTGFKTSKAFAESI